MSDYTLDEVRLAVEDKFDWHELSWEREDPSNEGIRLILRGTDVLIEFVDGYSGEEGDFSIDTFIVFRVGDQLFRKTGHYWSHHGEEWDGAFEEVELRPKTIEVYEPKES